MKFRMLVKHGRDLKSKVKTALCEIIKFSKSQLNGFTILPCVKLYFVVMQEGMWHSEVSRSWVLINQMQLNKHSLNDVSLFTDKLNN